MYSWRGTLDDASNTGYRAPVVPGQPACLLYALEHYGSGRLSRAQVMQPAIRLAEEGFDVDPYQAQTIAFAMRRLRAFPETMRTFFVDDGVPPVPATSTGTPTGSSRPTWPARCARLLLRGPRHCTAVQSANNSWPTCRRTAD